MKIYEKNCGFTNIFVCLFFSRKENAKKIEQLLKVKKEAQFINISSQAEYVQSEDANSYQGNFFLIQENHCYKDFKQNSSNFRRFPIK